MAADSQAISHDASTAVGDFPQRAEKSARRRVLVVDDEPLVRWSIAETLEDCRYDVLEARDAESAARALLEKGLPDVVLLDLRLPDCSDLSLLRTVRRLAPAAAVIVMTAFGTPEIREGARHLGAVSVVDKPFDLQDLQGLVARACRTR